MTKTAANRVRLLQADTRYGRRKYHLDHVKAAYEKLTEEQRVEFKLWIEFEDVRGPKKARK